MPSGAQSIQEHTAEVTQRNSRVQQIGTFGSKIGFSIDRMDVLTEVSMRIVASGAFAVAPTGVDVRQFIERVNIRSSDGDVISSISGQQLYDIVRLTEKNSTPNLVPGAGAGAVGSVSYSQEIHFEFDGAYFPFMTAIKGRSITKLDMEIEVASQAKIGAVGFVGATFAAAPAFTFQVDLEVSGYPEMVNADNVGTQVAFFVNKEATGTTSGRQTVELDPSNLTRFITMHVDNMTVATAPAPSDAILGDITLKQGARVWRETTWPQMRARTEQKRDLNVVGFAALDWGDLETGFLPLTGEPVQLAFNVLAGSPSWRVQVGQVYKKDRSAVVSRG